jgi:hypothetical protein
MTLSLLSMSLAMSATWRLSLDAGADVNLKSVPVREPVPLSDS